MSPNAVSSLVGDLVAMAQAAEALPQVQAALDNANQHIAVAEETIGHREAEIKSLRSEIATKLSTIQTLEASRDDAELRFLELEDRVGKLTSAFTVALEAMDMADAVAIDLGEWLKPKPAGEAHSQAEVKPDMKQLGEDTALGYPSDAGTLYPPESLTLAFGPDATPQGESATRPTSSVHGMAGDVASTTVESLKSAPMGESAVDPTHSEHGGEITTSIGIEHTDGVAAPSSGVSVSPDPTDVATPTAELTTTAMTSAEVDAPGSDPTKPYLGKRYNDVVKPGVMYYIPLRDWIAGGGTEVGYWDEAPAF